MVKPGEFGRAFNSNRSTRTELFSELEELTTTGMGHAQIWPPLKNHVDQKVMSGLTRLQDEVSKVPTEVDLKPARKARKKCLKGIRKASGRVKWSLRGRLWYQYIVWFLILFLYAVLYAVLIIVGLILAWELCLFLMELFRSAADSLNQPPPPTPNLPNANPSGGPGP